MRSVHPRVRFEIGQFKKNLQTNNKNANMRSYHRSTNESIIIYYYDVYFHYSRYFFSFIPFHLVEPAATVVSLRSYHKM